jgi:thioredoxin 1
MPLFVKVQGKLAMVSNEQAPIAAYRPGKQADHLAQAGPLGATAIKRGDVLAFINLEKIAPMLQGFVAMGMMQAQQNMAMMPDEGGMRDLSMAMMKIYGDIANGYLRDAKGLTYAVQIDQAGLDLSVYTQFKDGSYAAKLFPTATGDSLKLNRLPAKPYLYATAMDLGHMPLDVIARDVKAKLDQAVPADSQAQPIIKAYKAALDTIGSGLGNSQQAWFSPDMAGGPDPSKLFNITSVYTTDQPQQMLKAVRQYIQSVGSAMNSQAQAAGMAMPMTVEYKANVVQVDGKPVDQYKMELNMANNPAFQADPSFQMVMGIMSGAMQGYMLPTDDALVVVQGKGQVDMLGQVLAVGGQNKALESDASFSQVRPRLAGHRFSEAYINVGQGLEVALGYANMFAAANGMNLPPIAVPADLPPLAMSASSQDGGVGMQMHVPMKTATAVKDVVMQGVAAFQMGAMGGGGMGGPAQPQPMNNQPEQPAPEDTQAVEPAGDGEVVDLTADNFDQKVLAEDGVVLVDFWASWSAPCRRQAPIVDGLADTFADRAVIGRVNADEDSKLANQYNVRAIPTIILFKDGKEVERFQGLTEKDKLADAIRKAAGSGR